MRLVLIYCGCLVLIALNLIQQGLTQNSYAQEASTSTSTPSAPSDAEGSPLLPSTSTAVPSPANDNADRDGTRSEVDGSDETLNNEGTSEEEQSTLHPSLTQLYTHLLEAQTSRLIPDVRNGLIRVGTVLLEVDSSLQSEVDSHAAQALTQHLIHIIQQQSNLIHISFNENQEILNHFRATTSIFNDQETRLRGRLISLGRLLGVRYLFVGQIARNEGKMEFSLRVLSIKSKGWVGQASVEALDPKALKNFTSRTLFRETRWGGTWRSALLPGWGQFYQKRSDKGLLYSLSAVGLLAGGIMSYQQGIDYQDQYQVQNASSVPYRLRANDAFVRANFFWGALGTVWAMSVLDGYLSGQDRVHFRFSFNPQGGLALSGDF